MTRFNTTTVKKLATLSLAVAGIFGTTRVYADDFAGNATPALVAADYQPRSPEEIQQLTGPVALYPDALLAQVFVASTYPDDVMAAAQYLQNGGDPNQAGNFGWDQSVQGLLQTPDVLNQLAGDPNWMNQLGDTFLNQQQDVFASVQVLRQQAQNQGNLVTTQQQQVVATDNCIEILPANPEVIYVPVYNPEVVYTTRAIDIYNPCITFGTPISCGIWLHDDFDWHDHRIYFGNWGGDRPWWHGDHTRGFDYVHIRPGAYSSNVSWNHDNRREMPRHIEGAIVRHTEVTRTNVNIRQTNVTVRNNNSRTTVNRNGRTNQVSRTTNQPARQVSPQRETRTVTQNRPAGQTRQVQQTRTVSENRTSVQNRQVQQTHTVAQNRPVEQTRQVQQTHTVAQNRPATETRQVQQARTVAQNRPAQQTRQVQQTHTVAQNRPAAETRQVQQARTVAQNHPAAQTRQVQPTRTVTQNRPAAQTRQVQQTRTVTQSRTVQPTHTVSQPSRTANTTHTMSRPAAQPVPVRASQPARMSSAHTASTPAATPARHK